jgi:hypothetical protein
MEIWAKPPKIYNKQHNKIINVTLFNCCLPHEQVLKPLEPLNYLGGFSFRPYAN